MRYFSFAFGCRVNQAEKEQLDKKLLEMGWQYDEKSPDVYIINSCAVTQKAEREARQKIYQVRKKYPEIKIIVTGCSATLWRQKNVSDVIPSKAGIINENLFFIPNSQKSQIPEIISSSFSVYQRKNQRKSAKSHYKYDKAEFTSYSKYLKSGRLLIKIQDGCNYFCSYCIVPYLRGKPQSQKITDLINEINSFQGEKLLNEVVFTAVNTALFGKDTGEDLIGLINRTLKETDIPKISFGSIHPRSITDDFLNYYQKTCSGLIYCVLRSFTKEGQTKNKNRLVPFFHIPIQSGSNKILKLMNRGYTAEEMLKKLNKLHEINPKALISTDIIVGFPGETDEDFGDTLNFLRKSPIKKLHIFRYSERKETKTDIFKNINTRVQKERYQAISNLKLT